MFFVYGHGMNALAAQEYVSWKLTQWIFYAWPLLIHGMAPLHLQNSCRAWMKLKAMKINFQYRIREKYEMVLYILGNGIANGWTFYEVIYLYACSEMQSLKLKTSTILHFSWMKSLPLNMFILLSWPWKHKNYLIWTKFIS